MYTNYFGLSQKPFSISPDFSFLYSSEQHREALAHLLHGIGSDDCFILLTGTVGMGKSTVCQCLLEQLPEGTEAAVVANPCISVLELLATICAKLGVEVENEESDKQPYLDALHSYLLEEHANGRVVALVVDEAQNTSLDQLELLCSLTALKFENIQLLKIILIGQTELSQILNQQDASQISKYITSRYHLLPLDQKNCAAYVRCRLNVAGAKEKIFSNAALIRVFKLSHGIPRLINVLCDEALAMTCIRVKYLVTRSAVDSASEKVLGNVIEIKKKVSRKQLWVQVLCGLVLFLVGGGALSWHFSQQAAVEVKAKPVALQTVEPVVVVPVPVKREILEEKNDIPSNQTGSMIRIVPLEVSE